MQYNAMAHKYLKYLQYLSYCISFYYTSLFTKMNCQKPYLTTLIVVLRLFIAVDTNLEL